MIENKSYLRKEEMWIGYGAREDYFDICVPGFLFQAHLMGNKIFAKQEEGYIPIWNEKAQTGNEWNVTNGDILQLGAVEIIFLSDRIEVQAEPETYQTTLLMVRGDESPFEGFPYYKRSPRVVYRVEEEQIEIQLPPAQKEMAKGSLAQMIVPSVCMLGFTVAMGVFLKRGPYVYMTAGMTVITTLFSVQRFFSQKRQVVKDNQERTSFYEKYLLSIRKKIREARKKEREALDYQYPELLKLSKMADSYHSRIYERNALDADFLQVNLGYRNGRSQIRVYMQEKQLDFRKDPLLQKAKEIPKEYAQVEHIPVVIDLKRAHLGIVGSKENVQQQIRYLLAQLTFFQSYHDLQIVLIHDRKYKKDFSYARWYPHLRIRSTNLVADICDEQSRDQILGSLQQVLKERRQKVKEEQQESVFLPHFIFIIDEPKMVLNHAIMEYLQGTEMDLGVTVIYTTDQQANLPENIGTVCLLHNKDEATLLLKERIRVQQRFDVSHIDHVNLERMARNLSVLIHEQGVSSRIPEKVSFFEMYHVSHPEELEIRERWRTHHVHKSLAVPLGLRGTADIVELNLHEKAHGPHGLVAGTTGSGKSEIVQSYILSLAINFHPYEVGFLLIDYKGGGMANLFTNLPHLLGTITNLDKAESMRAMESIKSELHRRERIFGEAGVNHINGYHQLFEHGKVTEPLPHLFVISDEFAELKKEQPEFMSELVSTARVGRSLGIHLILATQKPSGVVDDQIWTNSRFKLCLKVQNAADSKEMLHTPDAANITQTGRAYLQVGNNEIYELFQSAWSGAAYDRDEREKEEKEDERVYLVNELGQGELLNQDLSGSEKQNKIRKTQLEVTVEHIRKVYEQEQEEQRSVQKIESVKKPWLPPLPEQIVSPYLQEIKDSRNFQKINLEIGVGLIDIPEEQRQVEYQIDFQRNGHFLYMASSGYGKSMLLTNIILGLCTQNSVEHLNIYMLDLGNNALINLKSLPHVADYMGIDDEEKLTKFQKLILDEISERKKKLAQAMVQNFALYNETQEEKMKAIVIAVDNYDAVSELGDSVIAFIQKVARDGAGLGIYLAVTMTRENVMRNVTKSNFKEKVAGYNFEVSEVYSMMGRCRLEIPESIKGRALVKLDNLNLMQLYTPVSFSQEVEYVQKLKMLITEICELSTEEKAKEIPVLPEQILYEQLSGYANYKKEPEFIPMGLDTETLDIVYLDVKKQPGFIIGESGMGRTNQLKSALKHIGDKKVYLFDTAKGDLLQWSTNDNVIYSQNAEGAIQAMEQLECDINDRREAYEEEKIGDVTLKLADFVKSIEPIYIVVDVIQELYESMTDMGEESRLNVIEEAVKLGFYLIVTANAGTFRDQRNKLLMLLKDSKEGVVVGNIKQQSIFSIPGIRETNQQPEIGYYFQSGKNGKLKYIDNEMN